MILTFNLALLVLAFFLQLGKRSKLSVFVLFLGILSLSAAGTGPVTEWTLNALQEYSNPITPEWKQSNLIIVLGNGQVRWSPEYVSPQVFGTSRITEAVRLYLNCKQAAKSCSVIASGGDPGGSGEPEAVTMKRQMMSLGVPEADILTEAESRDTYENASFVAKAISGKSFDNKILVTSGYHLKRSEICFQLNSLTVTPAPADRLQAKNSIFPDVANLFFNNLVAHEYAGIIKAYLIKTTGLNL